MMTTKKWMMKKCNKIHLGLCLAPSPLCLDSGRARVFSRSIYFFGVSYPSPDGVSARGKTHAAVENGLNFFPPSSGASQAFK